MTPQTSFMAVAPVRKRNELALRELLNTMNREPSVADPGNPLYFAFFGDFDGECDAFIRDLVNVADLNGTYLVFRQLQQDVRSFWRYMHETAGPAGALQLAITSCPAGG
jgi:hypothetical protein